MRALVFVSFACLAPLAHAETVFTCRTATDAFVVDFDPQERVLPLSARLSHGSDSAELVCRDSFDCEGEWTSDQGPVAVTTMQAGDRIYVQVYTRGTTYQFYCAVQGS